MSDTYTPGPLSKDQIKKHVQKNPDIKGSFALAFLIAANGHLHQQDKIGTDYGHHLIAVSQHATESEAKMIIGLLHDVLEDTDWAPDDLYDLGFKERVIQGILGCTKQVGEAYFDAVERASMNPDSLDVKLKDNRHNSDGTRSNALLTAKDVERKNKYIVTRAYLTAVKKGDIAPGKSVLSLFVGRPDNAKLFDADLMEKHCPLYREDCIGMSAENLDHFYTSMYFDSRISPAIS